MFGYSWFLFLIPTIKSTKNSTTVAYKNKISIHKCVFCHQAQCHLEVTLALLTHKIKLMQEFACKLHLSRVGVRAGSSECKDTVIFIFLPSTHKYATLCAHKLIIIIATCLDTPVYNAPSSCNNCALTNSQCSHANAAARSCARSVPLPDSMQIHSVSAT
jgi:hypothetical protein